ncbi:hypothetical protein H2200_013286 [Cladophialophora chaetospira]|uniref:Quinate repressor protein n=1 Tax=Cladophialophora chaetospira TaxID=386627 RepID=A0AA38U9R4_9EURO|nr:hypothetical protein H2200_013286 [Cladophialophora chaetospira]
MTRTASNGATSLSKRHGFEDEASIVLIGAPGTGKSSLAHIASSSFRMTQVDVNDTFRNETGLTRTAFRKQHGIAQTRDRELSLLRKILNDYSRNCVIVFPGDYTEEAGLLLLKQYSKEHPVILVRRCLAAVQNYLKPWDASKVERLLKLVEPVYRASSNFEFYNLDETDGVDATEGTSNPAPTVSPELKSHRPWSLRLKHLEKAFMHFVNNILHPSSTLEETLGQYSAPNSHAVYTYLLGVSLSQLAHDDFNVAWLDCGADACQLEIDLPQHENLSSLHSRADEIIRAFATTRRFFDGPIIFHVQRPTSKNQAVAAQYVQLLQYGLRLGVDYLTIDLTHSSDGYSKVFEARNIVKLIGDYHDHGPGSDGWSSEKRWNLFQKACDRGFHGLRVTQPALSADDNRAATHYLVEAARIPGTKPFLIAYNTLPLGRPSRCFNRILTPITTPELQSTRPHAEESHSLDKPITIQQSQSALYSSFTYDAMKYYIVGLDVSFSLSPVIHNAAHMFFGMLHRLERRSMDSVEPIEKLTNDPHCGGLSIAQGYKMSMLSRLSAVSDHARRIGAINTVIPIRARWLYSNPPTAEFWASRNRAGPVFGLYGDNLDWVGMRQCVLENLSPANVITERTTALIVGAGGMARAAFYALLQMGVQHVALFNRTPSNAVSMAKHFSDQGMVHMSDSAAKNPESGNHRKSLAEAEVRFLESRDSPWFQDFAPPTIVMACIPASSVAGEPASNFTLPQAWMTSQTGGVVLDLNYRPLVTPLLRQVRRHSDKGWVAVDGLENLAAQANAQFKVFTSRKVPKNLMRIEALKHCLAIHKDDEEVCNIIRNQLTQLESAT